LYYARPNRSSYSSIFSRAYKECKTEFGLRVAKLALKRLKVGDPARILSQAEVKYMIAEGDKLFDQVAASGDDFDPGCISELVNELLQEKSSTDFCSD
jgi:hypothetical protein